MVYLYLITLFIAPQLWLEPFVGYRVDLIIYPVWFVVAAASGRLNAGGWNHLDTIILTFFSWMLICSLLNGFSFLTGGLIFDYFKWWVLYRLIIASTPDFAALRRVCTFIIVLSSVLAVEAFQHRYSPDGIGWAGQTLGWISAVSGEAGRARWVGIFDGPGVFCVIFTIALPLIMAQIHKPFGFFRRTFFVSLLGLDLVAVYLTGSRGGLLASLAIIALHFALRSKGGLLQFKRWIFLLIPAAALVLALAPSHLTDLDDKENSAAHRVDMWADGLTMVEQNPVFGVGRGNFAWWTGTLIAHNSAIEIMGETGLPGLFLWITIIYLLLEGLLRAHRTVDSPHEQSYIRALALALIGYVISAMFVTLEYETMYGVLFGLCASMTRIATTPCEFRKGVAAGVSGIMSVWYVGLKLFVIAYVAFIAG